MTNRNDERYTSSDDTSARFRAYVNAMDMGGWASDDVAGFEEAVMDELREAGDTEMADGSVLEIQGITGLDEYGDPIWSAI